MRPLRHQASVESMHGEVAQGIRQPAIAKTVVVLARAPGQRLQRCLDGSAADLIQDAVDEDRAIVGGGHGQASRLDALLLLIDIAIWVSRVALVHAGVAEATNAELGCLPQQPSLV